MTRHIDFEGIENFRDFGGYATACGRGLKAGRLYRSGHHHLATDADLAKLAGLGLSAIVDLRHPNERRREPSRRWAGFEAQVIENDISADRPDWVLMLADAPLTPEWFYADGVGHYRANPFEPRHIDLYRRFFHAIAESDGPVLIHCAAGKDRTGFGCALAHHMAGVHHDDLMADFLLTNDESRIDRKMAVTAAWLASVVDRPISDEAVRVAVSVFPGYLDAAFETVRAECGSIDGYLETVLGLDGALRQRIHDRVLG